MTAQIVGIGERYDCGFKDASGNFIGLRLERDKNGVPVYQEINDPAVANQIYSGSIGYSSLKPQYELQIGQSDWRAGFGLEHQDSSDPKRFYISQNVDTRFKDMVIGGPIIGTMNALTLTAAIANGNLESWTADPAPPPDYTPDSWTTSSDNIDRSAGAHGGSYCCCLLSLGGEALLTQTATGWHNDLRGVYFVVSGWMKTAVASAGRLKLSDGVGTTTGSDVADDSAWHEVTVARVLDSGATEVTVAASSDVGDLVYVDDITIPSTGAVGNFCEFNDNLYYSSGGYLIKIDASTGVQSAVAAFPWSITSLATYNAAMGGTEADYLFIAVGADEYYYYMNAAGTITRSADAEAYHFKVIGNNIYRSILPYTVSVSNNPLAEANWTTDYLVGNIAENITGLVDYNGTPVICKENFPYYIDSTGDVYPLVVSLISEKASTAGKGAINWQGKIYIPCGTQALYEYDDGVLTDISPSRFVTNSSDFDGQVMGLAGDAQYLYAVIDNSTNIEVIAGRWEDVDGDTRWVWHPLYHGTFELNDCATSTVYKRRLWLGATTNSIKWLPIAALYGNITADTDYGKFNTLGYLITPWYHWDLAGDDKALISMNVFTENASATEYWTAYYQRQGDGSTWYTMGTTGKVTTSPKQTLYAYNSSAPTVYPVSTMIRFKFLYTSALGTQSTLKGFDARAVWYPTHKKVIRCSVVVVDNPLLNYGEPEETQSAATIRTALEAWNNPATAWPRAFYPPYYESDSDIIYCKLMPTADENASFCVVKANEKVPENIEWIYNLKLLVVTLS